MHRQALPKVQPIAACTKGLIPYIALVYTGLGEKDEAFDRLDKAYEEREAYLNLFEVEQVFDSLRSDPGFWVCSSAKASRL